MPSLSWKPKLKSIGTVGSTVSFNDADRQAETVKGGEGYKYNSYVAFAWTSCQD